ncbi:alpha/beta fold hydrolase [Micromonospora sp. CPCC 206061]|uniref:alpha/beta fold hydrolase n=1 Tax=Micromonospora sp. CPCC 206061 TaxID=3122410 RepID=UPI002FEFB97F
MSEGAATGSVQATAVWVTERVDVGGHELNLLRRGTGSPTIVFENGLGGNLGPWFQTGVANGFSSVRTCAYDRVNTGASDRDPGRHTGEDSVRDLHTLLHVAAVPAPYLLVGHSFGGLLAVMYAGTHPAEVAGLVLLDPSLPTQAELFDLLPKRERAAEMADLEKNRENVDFFDTLEQAKALLPRVPDIPVLVLGATNLDDIPPPGPTEGFLAARKKALQEFTAALSRGELRYVASGHAIHSAEPKLVINEIQRVLEGVR